MSCEKHSLGTRAKIEKARRSAHEILNCQRSSTAQLIVFFQGWGRAKKKMHLCETFL